LKIFGYNELGVRFFGVLSYIAIAISIFWVSKKYLSERFAWYAALFFFIMSDGLFYITVVTGEIDVFYAAITVAMFVVIFHFFQKEQYFQLFLTTYLLTALGTLTKGIPSLVFTALTLLVIFIDGKKFRKLFHPGHFAGIGLLIVIVGGYLWLYNQHHDVNALLFSEKDSIFAQTTDKSFLGSGFSRVFKHVTGFPLEFLSKMIPIVLFFIFVFRKSMVRLWMSQPLIRYFILIFFANILVYWLSPDTRSRYLYMLFPLPVAILVYAHFVNEKKWPEKVLRFLNYGLLMIVSVTLLIVPFISIEALADVEGYKIPVFILGILLIGFSVFYFKNPGLTLLPLPVIFVVARLVFDFTALPLKSIDSNMQKRKDDGIAIAELIKNEPLFLYKETQDYKQRIFYIERDAGVVVGKADRSDTENFFLVDDAYLQNPADYESFYIYEEKGTITHLVKFKRNIE
jgi:4-amino-4-deoxy-L-arabinose transferase-like glycosyltransferase